MPHKLRIEPPKSTHKGTEASLPRLLTSPEDVFPKWIRDNRPLEAIADTEDEDYLAAETADQELEHEVPIQPPVNTFMKSALGISGTEHIIDNACKECHEHLSWWPDFHAILKQTEALLAKTWRRQRFQATCLHGSIYAAQANKFDLWSHTLYSNRWREVVSFLRHLLPVLDLLILTFDADKFGDADKEPGEGAEHRFDAKLLQDGLRTVRFRWYVEMAFSLEAIPQAFASKTRGCPCHCSLPAEWGETRRAKMIQAHFQTCSTCPLQGCHGPYLAAGEVNNWLAEVAQLSLFSVLNTQPLHASPEDREVVVADFEAGKRVFLANLIQKFDFWQRLPWHFVGLCHHESSQRQRVAREVLAMIRQEREEAVHEPLTQRWMKGQPMLDLEAIAAGRDWSEVSGATKEMIAELFLAGCNETVIEEKHAKVTAARHRNARLGMVMASLSNRLILIQRHLEADPAALEGLVSAMTEARTIRLLPALMGLQKHPAVVAAAAVSAANMQRPTDERRKRRFDKTLRKALPTIVYRMSLEDQFADNKAAARKHVSKAQEMARVHARFAARCRPQKKVTFSTMFLHWLQAFCTQRT
eukprot:6492757-Amphidinium_carterae.2